MALWKEKFIKPNPYSRPQKKMTAIKKVVIHWTANYGAGAENHFKYFNNLSGRYASAHFFVDKDEALQILPLNEISYHANDGSKKKIAELKPNANFLSVGIEMCVEKDGSFHADTVKQTVAIAAELCKRYKLDPKTDIVRHYDITGKSCPTPWVKNSAPFTKFKNDVAELMKGGATTSGASTVPPTKVSGASNPTLKKGDKGVAVERLQVTLNKVLGSGLTPDGDFGAGTDTVVRNFQKKMGLAVDGVVGQSTWDALASPKLNAEAVAKPSAPVAAETPIGKAVVKSEKLAVRTSADLVNSKVLRELKQGDERPVYELKSDFLRIGKNEWINNGGGRFTTFKPSNETIVLMGTVEILKDIPVRETASTKGKATGKVLKKGGKYKVYAFENGMYNVGDGQWIYSKGGFTRLFPL